MERLTRKDEFGVTSYNPKTGYVAGFEEIRERLYQYEETELSPEEIEKLKNDFNFMQELYKGSESAKNLYLKGQHRAEELNRELANKVEELEEEISILRSNACIEEVEYY